MIIRVSYKSITNLNKINTMLLCLTAHGNSFHRERSLIVTYVRAKLLNGWFDVMDLLREPTIQSPLGHNLSV